MKNSIRILKLKKEIQIYIQQFKESDEANTDLYTFLGFNPCEIKWIL